jgi:hypothetical protein
VDNVVRFVEDFSDLELPVVDGRLSERDAYFLLGIVQSFKLRANALLDRKPDAKR